MAIRSHNWQDLPPGTDLGMPDIQYVTREIPCPVCKSADLLALYPGIKFNDQEVLHLPHPEIKITLCNNCGLVFENPQISIPDSPDYADRHYYNKRLRVARHDEGQKERSFFHWTFLRDRLPWAKIRKTVDVGACGAWSNWVHRHSDAECTVVEPSSEAIKFCREHYPEIEAVHATFAQFEGVENTFDLITFIDSFYMLPDPVEALEKAKKLLKPDGTLSITISQSRLDLEIWTEERPWVNLYRLIQTGPMILYSRKTLQRALEVAGFEIVENSVFQFPFWSRDRNRQYYHVIARPKDAIATTNLTEDLSDLEERNASFEIFTRYCEICTENPLTQFFAVKRNVKQIYVVHDGDEIYAAWVKSKLLEFSVDPIMISRLEYSPMDIAKQIEDEEEHIAFFAGDHRTDVTEMAEDFSNALLIDCAIFEPGGYGNWIEEENGQVVIGRAFCPYYEYGERLFPFEREMPVNDYMLPKASFEGYEEYWPDPKPNPRHDDRHPQFDWAEAVIIIAQQLDRESQETLFQPIFSELERWDAELVLFGSMDDFLEQLGSNYSRIVLRRMISYMSNELKDELFANIQTQMSKMT